MFPPFFLAVGKVCFFVTRGTFAKKRGIRKKKDNIYAKLERKNAKERYYGFPPLVVASISRISPAVRLTPHLQKRGIRKKKDNIRAKFGKEERKGEVLNPQ